MSAMQGTINRRLGQGDTNRFPIDKGQVVYLHPELNTTQGRMVVSIDAHASTGYFQVPENAIDFDYEE